MKSVYQLSFSSLMHAHESFIDKVLGNIEENIRLCEAANDEELLNFYSEERTYLLAARAEIEVDMNSSCESSQYPPIDEDLELVAYRRTGLKETQSDLVLEEWERYLSHGASKEQESHNWIPRYLAFTYFQRLYRNVHRFFADLVKPLNVVSYGLMGVLGATLLFIIIHLMSSKMQTVDHPLPNSFPTPLVLPSTLASNTSRQALQVYTVKAGDTVLTLAAQFGLEPETIMWANPKVEQDPDLLDTNDQLTILPVNGVLLVAKPGDTLSGLAATYKVKVEAIIGYKGNHIASTTAALTVGRQLMIPDGRKEFVLPTYYTELTRTVPAPANANKGNGTFAWPTGDTSTQPDKNGHSTTGTFSWPSKGAIIQPYWSRHPAIDIALWVGASIKAADSGYVALAKSSDNNTGYGNYIVIDHGNGFTTLYAHLSAILVKPGANVTRGEQIGIMGNPGHSTGPHLHFEVRYLGVQRDPAAYLP